MPREEADRVTLRIAWALLALLAWLAAGLAVAGPASAHAVLLSSEPAAGAELAQPPAEVLLRFSEPVAVPPEAIRVFDAGGQRADLGDPGHGADRSQVRVGLPAGLGDGVFTVTWRVVSSDDHPVRGSFTFTVGDPGDAVAVAPEDVGGGTDLGWSAAAAAVRWATYAGTLLAAGGALFLLLVHDRRDDELPALTRVPALAAVLAVAASVAYVPLHGALTTGLGWRALADTAVLGGTLTSGVGLAALLRVAGLALLVAALPRLRSGAGPALAAAGAVLAPASFLLTGHTATSEPRALVLAANLTHSMSAAVWFGGLVLMGLVLRRRAAPPVPAGGAGPAGSDVAETTVPAAVSGARLVRRFSDVALASVLALIVAGLALAWVEVRSLEALVSTRYGWTLLAKVALVAVVVALAAYNRRRLVGAVSRAGDAAWRTLASTVRIEAGVMVAVLGVTAALVTMVPARTAAGIGEPFVDYVALGSDHQVNVVVDPARTGRNEIHLYLLDEAGQLADLGADLELRLSLPEAGIAPIEAQPFVAGPGHWLHVGNEMSIPGRWRVEIRVLVSEFERLTAIVDVDVGGRAR